MVASCQCSLGVVLLETDSWWQSLDFGPSAWVSWLQPLLVSAWHQLQQWRSLSKVLLLLDEPPLCQNYNANLMKLEKGLNAWLAWLLHVK